MTEQEILNELYGYMERLSKRTKQLWLIDRFYKTPEIPCSLIGRTLGGHHRAVLVAKNGEIRRVIFCRTFVWGNWRKA